MILTDMGSAIDPQLSILINKGKYIGPNGAVAIAKKEHLEKADEGYVSSMMVLANVYYSAATALYKYGFVYWPFALIWMFKSYGWSKRALLAATNTNNEMQALNRLSTWTVEKIERSNFGYGELHVYMSALTKCAYVRRKFWGETLEDSELAYTCCEILRKSPSQNFVVLGLATILEWPEFYGLGRAAAMQWIQTFVERNKNTTDPSTQQTIIRACRSAGWHEKEQHFAKKFGTLDQQQKAGVLAM